MFNPSRDEVRRFFIQVCSKYRERSPLIGLEIMAVDVILQHPEYQDLLAQGDDVLPNEYGVDGGETNPFLHLSLHLAVEEQLSINQPEGIRDLFDRLCTTRGERHTALHDVVECLGETVWSAQRTGLPPDANKYLDCLRKHHLAT